MIDIIILLLIIALYLDLSIKIDELKR